MAPFLGYWGLRGIANPIRVLLHHVDERFEDRHYGMEDFDKWFNEDKPALEGTMDFPNLPHFIDGKVQISQTKVILAYLGRKHNLDASTEEERIRMGLAIEVLEEYRQALSKVAYQAPCVKNREEVHETLRKEYEEQLPTKLGAVSKFIGKNKWVAGDRLTYADFFVYDILDFHRILFNPKFFEADTNLCAYMKRFENLPRVKQYMASSAYMKLPIYAPFALFGNTTDYKAV